MPTARFILCSGVIVVAIWAMATASLASRTAEPPDRYDQPNRVRLLIDLAATGETPEVRQAATEALEREFQSAIRDPVNYH